MTATRSTSMIGRILGIAATFGAAASAAAAVQNGHSPAARDLRRLGIDPAAFGAIKPG